MLTTRTALLALFLAVMPATSQASARRRAPRAAEMRGMVRLPAGSYRPLYATAGHPQVQVGGYWLDREPVTRAKFRDFVARHPAWRRDAVSSKFAEPGYLADWPGALEVGTASDAHRPVTNVSWFAARAYCDAQGKRLPTLDEWEYAAAASERVRDARDDATYRRRLMSLYTARRPDGTARVGSTFTNVYGVADLHGLVWEWTIDVNPAVAAEAARVAPHAERSHHHHAFCASAAIGAADPTDYPAFLRFAMRGGLTTRSTVRAVGFRCAAGVSG